MFVLLLPLLVVMARAGKRSLPDYLPFLVLVLLVPAILFIRHLLQTVSRRRISQKMTFLSFMLCYGVAAVAALFLMPLARALGLWWAVDLVVFGCALWVLVVGILIFGERAPPST